ncbi:hypothetical protein VCUG_01538 [Vavraia culicis subsp. floridensis]|uniref:Uncharacterized protein n=1 Tax=Vavraia culicis (isolate floridensis) TaxID=948595 RepID=L2GUH7_VAVCU|nr:uncharacterized protein VCUG_01538 [Vavraia culicis subsp. floridensis]ELA47007.1 hypothetical protein VCUG_01538 [Vavraia culicis subsp. floridensis]
MVHILSRIMSNVTDLVSKEKHGNGRDMMNNVVSNVASLVTNASINTFGADDVPLPDIPRFEKFYQTEIIDGDAIIVQHVFNALLAFVIIMFIVIGCCCICYGIIFTSCSSCDPLRKCLCCCMVIFTAEFSRIVANTPPAEYRRKKKKRRKHGSKRELPGSSTTDTFVIMNE